MRSCFHAGVVLQEGVEIGKLGLATHLGEGVRYDLFPTFGMLGLLRRQKAQMQEERDFETQELARYPAVMEQLGVVRPVNAEHRGRSGIGFGTAPVRVVKMQPALWGTKILN